VTVQKAFRNAAVEEIIESLVPLIEKAPKSSAANFTFHASKELGGPHLLDGLWHKLGMAEVLHSLVKERQFQNPLERLIFAMVAGRILKRGRSKDGRSELPLVSIAFAVTRTGIPLRCWVFPGNTSDQTIVEEVKEDLGEWNLGHVIMVKDAGFNSADNRRILLRDCGEYIIGEKLKVGREGTAVEALLDGKFLISTSSMKLDAAELVAQGTSSSGR